jgi:hypothetical protein
VRRRVCAGRTRASRRASRLRGRPPAQRPGK